MKTRKTIARILYWGVPIFLALFGVLLFVLAGAAGAQNATSVWGIPIQPPPPGLFSPEPMPSGDTADGLGLFLDPATKTINWLQAHLDHGPSSLTSNVPVTGQQWTMLASPVNYATFGFRESLVSYPPAGVWELDGRVIVLGLPGVGYDVLVTLGTALSPDPGRRGILSESRVVVGGGTQPGPEATPAPGTPEFSLFPDGTVRTAAGVVIGLLQPDGTLRPGPHEVILGQLQGNGTVLLTNGVVVGPASGTPPGVSPPFTIPIAAHDIRCPAAVGQACEVLVWIYPRALGPAGVVLAAVPPDATGGGGIPPYFASSFVVRRVRR